MRNRVIGLVVPVFMAILLVGGVSFYLVRSHHSTPKAASTGHVQSNLAGSNGSNGSNGNNGNPGNSNHHNPPKNCEPKGTYGSVKKDCKQ